jgi:outer membrane immunogenic protein
MRHGNRHFEPDSLKKHGSFHGRCQRREDAASNEEKTMKLLLSGVALGVLVMPAMAADMAPAPYYRAPVPVFSWTGCYVGGDVGGAWSSQDVSNTAQPFFFLPPFTQQRPASASASSSGVIGGGYVGCNFQWTPSIVVGVEGDYSAASLGGSANAPSVFFTTPIPGPGITWSSTLDSIATVRGRIGYVWTPNTLLYFTGGGAWGRASYASTDAFLGNCPGLCATTPSFSNTGSGYVLGGGIEWAPWSNNWIVRAEYLYYSLGGATGAGFFTGATRAETIPVWNNVTVNLARLGLSYKF